MATNKITTDLEARGADKMSRDLAKVGDSAAKAGHQVEDLGADAKAASKGVDSLGDEAKQAVAPLAALGAEAGQVERQIADLQQGVKDLAAEFDRTGDKSLIKQIFKGQRETRKLIKIQDLLPDPGEAAKGGMELMSGLITGMTGFIKGSGGPIIMGVLAAAAVAAAPFVGATIGAAVLGGAGAGGIVGGIMLAARDPRVQAAGEEFATAALGSLDKNIGAAFVDPAVSGLNVLSGTVEAFSSDMAPALADIAHEIGPLVKGIDGMAHNAVPGLTKALNAAEPIIRIVSGHLPDLGSAVSDASSDIADGADGMTMALDVFLDLIEGIVISGGALVGWLGETYEGIIRVADGIGAAADKTPDWAKNLFPLAYALGGLNNAVESQVDAMDAAVEPAGSFAGGLHDIGNAAGTAEEQIDGMKTAMDELMGITMDAHQASIAYEQAIDDLAAELADGKKTFDERSEAGRRNLEVVDRTIDAINQQRDANIANNMSVADANAIADAQLAKLDATVAKFGKTSAEVRNYIAEIRNIPTLAQLRIEVDGLAGAIAQMQALRRLLGSNVAAINQIQGGEYISGRAVGGPVKAGVPYLVGEQGPELIVPGQSGTVMTASQTAAMRSGASGGSAQRPTGGSYTIGVAGGMEPAMTALVSAILPYLTLEVGRQGGSISAIVDSRM